MPPGEPPALSLHRTPGELRFSHPGLFTSTDPHVSPFFQNNKNQPNRIEFYTVSIKLKFGKKKKNLHLYYLNFPPNQSGFAFWPLIYPPTHSFSLLQASLSPPPYPPSLFCPSLSFSISHIHTDTHTHTHTRTHTHAHTHTHTHTLLPGPIWCLLNNRMTSNICL